MRRRLLNIVITICFLFTQFMPLTIKALEDSSQENEIVEESSVQSVKGSTDVKVTGNLEIDLKFVLPIFNTSLINMNIKLTDKDGNFITLPLNDIKDPSLNSYTFGPQNVDVMVRKLDKEGLDLEGIDPENFIVYIGTTIYGLEKGTYQIEISGDGYNAYTTSVTIDDYSKRIILSNESGLLEAGDVNGNNLVDANDIDLMIHAFGTEDNKYDLNRDGKIDIADLNYITASINGESKSVQIVDTIALVDVSNVSVIGNIEGDISNLFIESGNVSISPLSEGDISENNPAEMTIELDNAINASQLRLDTGYDNVPTNMVVTVITENDEKIEIPKTFSLTDIHTFTDKANANTIVVDLGKQVAVKRVIITITETSSNKLADIAKVDFLNNVYETVPIVEVERPTNLNVSVGSEQAFVTFDNMRNVTGYEILVEELNESGTTVGSVVYQTTYNEFQVTGLKNYTTYNIRVQSVNQEWKSGYGNAVSATPVPTKKPPKVDMVSVSPVYAGFNISWKKMDDTLTYNVYYRKKGTKEYTVVRDINSTSYQLRDLEVGVEYEICVSGSNSLGEGPKSDTAVGTTLNAVMPNVTNYGLINRPNDTDVTDHIKSVTINSSHFKSSEFALVDNKYETYWKASTWDTGGYNKGRSGPIIEFDDFYEMDYVLLVPDIDSSFFYVRVYYWDDNGTMQQANAYIQSLTSSNGQKYYKIGFNQPIKTNKIQICLANYSASGSITVREMKFYEHDVLLDEVASLFKDDLRVELEDNVTLELISDIENKVNTVEEISGEYTPNRSILLNDLNYARQILNDENIQDIITIDTSISTANDTNLGFAMTINDFQPLGVVARPGEKLAIYVGNTGSIQPELIFTQYYAEANVWNVTYSVKLKNGQNIIEVPKIGSGADERGGSIYIRYPGTSSNSVIKVRVSGGTKIPVLDLHNQTDDTIKRQLISDYLNEINNYVSSLPDVYSSEDLIYNKKTSVLNSTEIVTDEGLFSIPASIVVESLANLDNNEKTEQLLETTKAFDEMVNMFYNHKGLSDDAVSELDKTPTSRINIRYMRMFDGAFMYAGGKHIGVGYDSTGGLLKGKTYGDGNNFSGYFGWGISHEIGHQINQGNLVYAEVTNNVYSLLAQTANDTSKSRLETSNIYPKIYQKVTSGTQGKSSNVFVSLGMYWQLHLAYDDNLTFEDTDSIFAKINQYSRRNNLKGSKDDLLVMYASDAAGENLIEFFEKWGYVISDSAKEYVNSKYDTNSKAIWYLNDDARRYRINGGTGISSTTEVKASITNADTQNKKITLTFDVTDESDKILGYEIKRNGEVIMFTTSNTFTDVIGAMNNRAVTYEVTAYDKLLNTTNTVVLDEIKIAHDGSLNKSNFTIESNTGEIINYEDESLTDIPTLSINQLIDGDSSTAYIGTNNDGNDSYVIINLNRSLALSGIKYTAALENETLMENTIHDYEVYVSSDKENWTLAKSGSFNVSDSNPIETIYFDKEGTTGGNQLWTYNNIAYVKIVSIGNKNGLSGAEIDLIAPPGDNVELNSNNIGILSENYCYEVDQTGKQECIKEGMVVFKGEYRGDPAFNVVLVANADNELVRYSGESLFFAQLNNEGNVYEVADGTWIYAITKEEYEKIVGKDVRAYLYRVDDALSLDGERLTSTSLKVKSLPEYSELPQLKITSQTGGN